MTCCTGSAGSIPRAGSLTARSPARWAGDRLTFTAAAGVVIARRDPDGMITMPAKPYVAIPAALCRRCGLRAGDRILLAVLPAEDALAAYSLAVVHQALRAHAPFPHAAGGPS